MIQEYFFLHLLYWRNYFFFIFFYFIYQIIQITWEYTTKNQQMFRFLEKKRVLLRTEKKIPPCLTVQKYPKVNQVKCSTCCSIFLVFLSFHIQLFHKINLSNNQMMMTTKMMMGGSFFFFVTSTKQQCCL